MKIFLIILIIMTVLYIAFCLYSVFQMMRQRNRILEFLVRQSYRNSDYFTGLDICQAGPGIQKGGLYTLLAFMEREGLVESKYIQDDGEAAKVLRAFGHEPIPRICYRATLAGYQYAHKHRLVG